VTTSEEQLPLFTTRDESDARPKPENSTAGRLTLRNNTALAEGNHPQTNQPLAATDETCGTGAHPVVVAADRTYLKCDAHRLGLGRSRVGHPGFMARIRALAAEGFRRPIVVT